MPFSSSSNVYRSKELRLEVAAELSRLMRRCRLFCIQIKRKPEDSSETPCKCTCNKFTL